MAKLLFYRRTFSTDYESVKKNTGVTTISYDEGPVNITLSIQKNPGDIPRDITDLFRRHRRPRAMAAIYTAIEEYQSFQDDEAWEYHEQSDNTFNFITNNHQ